MAIKEIKASIGGESDATAFGMEGIDFSILSQGGDYLDGIVAGYDDSIHTVESIRQLLTNPDPETLKSLQQLFLEVAKMLRQKRDDIKVQYGR